MSFALGEQKSHREHFKQAVLYAKAALADRTIRTHYETTAAELGKRPFDLAVADYFKSENIPTE